MSTVLYITPDRVILSAGKIDTNNKYLQTTPSGIPLPHGVTWFVAISGDVGASWYWSDGVDSKSYSSASGGSVSGSVSYDLVGF